MEHLSQLRRTGLFESRAPRYTSYPPATQFRPTVDGTVVAGWMEALDPGTPVSLYVHVPFCRRLCWFCACRTQGTQSLKPVADYVQAPLTELRQLRARLPQGITLSRLHWGGGTPTLLTPACWPMLSTRRSRSARGPNSRSRSTRPRSTPPGWRPWCGRG